MAQQNIALQIRAAQVEVSVGQARRFPGAAVFHNLKWRRFAFAQNAKLCYLNFNIARRDFLVL